MEKEKEKKRRSWFERIRRLFTFEQKQKPNKPPEKHLLESYCAEGEEQAVAAGEAADADLVRAAGPRAGAGAGGGRGPDHQAGGGRAEQARDGRGPRHRCGCRGGCRGRARRRRGGPPQRQAAAAAVQARAGRRRDPVGVPRVPGSAGAARAQGSGAAAGADPWPGGTAADGGHAARARVPDEDPGAAPRRRRRGPAVSARRAGAVRRGRPRAGAGAAAGPGRQGRVGQQHLLKGRDERHDAEQGGGRLEARARPPVRLRPKREAGHQEAAHVEGRDGPAVELAGRVGRLPPAALRQGHPRGAPVTLPGRRPARLLGAPVLRPAAADAGARGRGPVLLRRLRRGGRVPGVHGLHGVGQGQVPVHEHAQGALLRRRLRRLLGALLPVRRPHALADPLHVAHPVHRQRHGFREVRQAARRAGVAQGGQGAHDAREVAVPEIAEPPQLRLRGGAAPDADGAIHPSPVNRRIPDS